MSRSLYELERRAVAAETRRRGLPPALTWRTLLLGLLLSLIVWGALLGGSLLAWWAGVGQS